MSRVDHTIALVDDRNTRPFSIQIETCEMPSIDIQNLIAAPESHSKRFWPPSRHDTYFLVSYRARPQLAFVEKTRETNVWA